MKAKTIVIKGVFVTLALISIIVSLITSLMLLIFTFNPDEKETLQMFLGSLILCSLLWGLTFYVSKMDGEKTKQEKWNEIKNIIIKTPLILVSSLITSVYIFIYFFMFSFLTVSKYGEGGMAGDASFGFITTVFLILGVTLFGLIMYNVFKTEKADITLTLYNQFSVLKWSSLVALPFGVWASYYFYHTEKSTSAWIAMFFWWFVFYAFYALFNKLSNKVHEHITNANLNRIIHEKKKSIINQNQQTKIASLATKNKDSVSIADELKKFKDLFDQGAITQEEYNKQKNRLLS